MSDQIILRKDTAEAWAALNPVLGDGEPALDTTNDQLRVGNGVDRWLNLLPIGAVGLADETTPGVSRRATDDEVEDGTSTDVTVSAKQVAGAIAAALASSGGGSLGGQVLVWRYTNGAYPTLPDTPPSGTRLVQAIGPTQPTTVPSWVGEAAGQVPALYTVVNTA